MFRQTLFIASVLSLAACGSGTPEATTPDISSAEPEASGSIPQPGIGAVAYTGAVIWDGTGSAMQQGSALLVRDGRIEGIVADVPAGAEIVDLSGRFIVPGFVNAHGHVSGRWADDGVTDTADKVRGDLSLYARYGVTTVLSLGGAPAETFSIRDAQDSAELAHARVYVAGEVVAGNTAEEASAVAAANLNNGVDWLKLRVDDNLGSGSKMPWDAVQAAISAAKAANVPVATHIFYMDDASRLLAMGTGLIAHSVRDRQVTDEFVQAMLDSGVCYVPTLVREVSTFVYADRPDWFDDPFFLEGAKRSEIDRVSDPEFRARIAASPSAGAYRDALVQAQDNLRILVGSGVPVAFGTDSGPAGRFIGYFEHMEFDLMAEAGLTTREILMSATSVAASCLDLDDVGTLEAGKWADFVVMTGNPIADISATRSIERVFVAGNAVDSN
ncbi:MAG: amidohydrolase family protein [Gammaproteobacteria bacterium]|nr:amidohydrolase family protein [Gammaproteobacteria bacterium]